MTYRNTTFVTEVVLDTPTINRCVDAFVDAVDSIHFATPRSIVAIDRDGTQVWVSIDDEGDPVTKGGTVMFSDEGGQGTHPQFFVQQEWDDVRDDLFYVVTTSRRIDS